MVSNQNDDMKLLADNLWDYFKPKLYEYLGKEISYFRATVVENNNDGTLIVKRPFDNPFAVKCTEAMQTASVGDSVLVLIFGENAGTNGLVVGSSDARYLFVTGTDGNIYTQGANATDVVLECKNLLLNNGVTETANGVTFTVNSDGSVTVRGTATALTDFRCDSQRIPINNGDYLFNGITGGSSSTYRLFLTIYDNASSSVRYVGTNDEDAQVTINNESVRAFIRVYSGATVNFTAKPMLRDASITDDNYVPHAMTNRQVTTLFDGLLRVKFFSTRYTVGANSHIAINTSSFIDTPDGYTMVGVVSLSTNSAYVVPFSFRPRASNNSFELKNLVNTAITTDLQVWVLYCKTECFVFG